MPKTNSNKKRSAVKILLHGGYKDHVRIHYYKAASAKDAAKKAQRSHEWGPYHVVHHPWLCNDPSWFYEVREVDAPSPVEIFELNDIGCIDFDH